MGVHALYPLFRPLLFAADPELAHDVALGGLDAAARFGIAQLAAPRLPQAPVDAMGIRFPNPVGLAAGLDKNAAHLAGLATLGFGFVEAGTVTPRAQPGNPRPRMFRVVEAQALINRLGFNNDGVDAFVANVDRSGVPRHPRHQHRQELRHAERARRRRLRRVPARRARARELRDDQRVVAEHARACATCRERARSSALLAALTAERDALAQTARPARAAGRQDRARPRRRRSRRDRATARPASDRRRDRDEHHARTRRQSAALRMRRSGRTVGCAAARAFDGGDLKVLATTLDGALPIIGVGGILSAADAQAKIDAGAALVQLYTGLIYRGPDLVAECVRALAST